MTKFGLLGSSALRSAFVVGATFAVAAPAYAQADQNPQATCNANDPNYDSRTGTCTQPPEGTPGQTAPGTNPATTPSDEEPTQEELDPDASDSETLVVTGSRIPRPQFEGTIPGAQVTAEQIQARSFTSALEVLNDIPLVGPGASPFGTNGGQPGSLGASFVDLLDLGTARTLTLVNGRRFISGNQGTLFVAGNVTGSQVDLNVIPTALISRFDVLTVGGAAAYGSDAIAGVVNAILRDDFEGVQLGGVVGITERGDGFNYRVTAIGGMNFAGERGNVTASFENVFDRGLQADRRPEFLFNPVAPTSFRNGSVRNPAFAARLQAPENAFLPAASDLVPNNVGGSGFGFGGGSILVSPNGSIFGATGTTAGLTNFQGIASGIPGSTLPTGSPNVLISVAGNANLVPGVPVSAALARCDVANLTQFCQFAPTALPGTGAARDTFANSVVTRFAPTLAGQGTQAERNALALQLLRANRPTPREFLAANPGTDINAFVGSLVQTGQGGTAFLTVPNTNPATSALLPRVAVPLQFDANGNIIEFLPATIDANTTPSTTGGAVGGTGAFNPSRFTVLRAEQQRYIGNLFAHFDITDNLTVYTENLYARVETTALNNQVASSNSIANGTTENAALVFNINNPFLDAGDRARLLAAGVPANGNFILSRTNQDLAGPDGVNEVTSNGDTYRTALGLKGDFGVFGRNQTFDVSFAYGKNKAATTRLGILDVEYALALDAVRDPATGNIVCRSQIDPNARAVPRGIAAVEIVRERDANGVLVERVLPRQVTAEQIAACTPLNPFGFSQFSQAARDYVTADTVLRNQNEQYFGQVSLAGSVFDLPGGPLGYALTADYRKETLEFTTDEISRLGRTRSAALAGTSGQIENIEVGAEVRIPIFGEDFNIPLFRNLDFTPAVRFVRQSGDAPDVRLLNGTLVENEAKGKWNTIYSLAGSWRPVRDLTFRANITRSLRQPSIVELFLGGQPAFNAFTDPCGPNSIGGGLNPTVRRANCEAAVIAAGFATNQAGAATFLGSFVPSGVSVTGSFNGAPGLRPERGESYTVGGAYTPSFLPGFRISADYIDVKVLDQIIPTTLTRALQVCFDSPNFPDVSGDVGVNTCSFFTRNTAASGATPSFEVGNGFTSGFINLGALQVKALNMTAQYNVPLADWIGSDIGKLELFANAYHLISYKNSTNGDLRNPLTTFENAGTVTQPDWEVQLRARYEHTDGFYGQWTANWQDASAALGISAAFATIEEQDLLRIPSFSTHDATVGWSFGEEQRFGFQVTVNNVFDKRFGAAPGQAISLASGGRIDDFGRRFRISANVKF
jgi:outer membrane receptor protein involved in Fe transport